MKLHRYLIAIILAAFVSFAHAEPEQGASSKPNLGIFADPIAQFATPREEAVGDLLLQAMSLMGVAYRFGGTSPDTGLDCSGFIQYVFRKSLHVNLPRTSAEMANAGRVIDRSELVPGDLVFYNTRGFKYSHVGLYLGSNKFIHSPRTGKSVEVVNMNGSYWEQRFNGARRVNRGGVDIRKSAVAESKPARDSSESEAKPNSRVSNKEASKVGRKGTKAEPSRKASKTKSRRQEAKSGTSSKKSDKKPVRKKKKPD